MGTREFLLPTAALCVDLSRSSTYCHNRAQSCCSRDLHPPSRGSPGSSRPVHTSQSVWRRSHPQNVEIHNKTVPELWQEFFADPSQWWDNRSEKSVATYPDFKHKKTHESLWINNRSNPPWVETELAAMLPGPIQLNLFSWNKKLKACMKSGEYEKTLEMFHQMQYGGINPDKFSFVPVFQACARLRALDEGRKLHLKSIEIGCDSDTSVGNSLLQMYVKCGKVDEAGRVFSKMSKRDVVSWNAIIHGYAKCRQPQLALDLSRLMQSHGMEPNAVTFVGLLNACTSLAALDQGRYFHEQILRSGCDRNVFVCNSLINMYAKCGSMNDAMRIFDTMPTRTVVTWSAMIYGYVKCGLGQKALTLYKQMQQEGVQPNNVTFAGVLNACASLTALEEGRLVHREIIQRGLDLDTIVGNSLADMYAKCGRIEDAWDVFSTMCIRSEVSWNIMILGFVKCGLGQRALHLARRMQLEEVEPNQVTFVGMLKACVCIQELEEERHCHEQIIQQGPRSSDFLVKSIVRMHVKSGNAAEAWRLFSERCTHNAVNWEVIGDVVKNSDQGQKTFKVSRRVQQEKVEPNSLGFRGLPSADSSVAAVEEGRRVHEQIIQRGFELDVVVSTQLVDMYAKCGSMEDAWRVFNEIPTRDVGAWSSMIQGYVKWGQGQRALAFARQMQQEGVEPDKVAFAAVLSACASVTAVGEGRLVHDQIIQRGWESDPLVGSSLVDMYAKCGSIEDAWRVFDKMPSYTLVAWSAIILGYMQCGQQEKAAQLFKQMQCETVEPESALQGC